MSPSWEVQGVKAPRPRHLAAGTWVLGMGHAQSPHSLGCAPGWMPAPSGEPPGLDGRRLRQLCLLLLALLMPYFF